MAIRDVKPFDDKQWNQLQINMKDGAATVEQASKIDDARARAKKIPRENF